MRCTVASEWRNEKERTKHILTDCLNIFVQGFIGIIKPL